jgi:hypothetical protein
VGLGERTVCYCPARCVCIPSVRPPRTMLADLFTQRLGIRDFFRFQVTLFSTRFVPSLAWILTSGVEPKM